MSDTLDELPLTQFIIEDRQAIAFSMTPEKRSLSSLTNVGINRNLYKFLMK